MKSTFLASKFILSKNLSTKALHPTQNSNFVKQETSEKDNLIIHSIAKNINNYKENEELKGNENKLNLNKETVISESIKGQIITETKRKLIFDSKNRELKNEGDQSISDMSTTKNQIEEFYPINNNNKNNNYPINDTKKIVEEIPTDSLLTEKNTKHMLSINTIDFTDKDQNKKDHLETFDANSFSINPNTILNPFRKEKDSQEDLENQINNYRNKIIILDENIQNIQLEIKNQDEIHESNSYELSKIKEEISNMKLSIHNQNQIMKEQKNDIENIEHRFTEALTNKEQYELILKRLLQYNEICDFVKELLSENEKSKLKISTKSIN